MRPISVDDYREVARRRLPRFLFDYLDGGALSENTMRRNRSDLDRIVLPQRVMRDVSSIDMSAEILGCRYALPVALAPVGLAGLYARRGECQAARAAAAADIPFCLSTVSACSIDEVAAATDRPFWFQLYMIRDRVLCAICFSVPGRWAVPRCSSPSTCQFQACAIAIIAPASPGRRGSAVPCAG